MSISELRLHGLRNFVEQTFILHPRYNIFHGANGSGKTSVLEAVYLLSCGHSFRTRQISPLIKYDAENLTVFARTTDDITVSIQKSLHEKTRVRLNQQDCKAASELARVLPCQVLHYEIFEIMNAGPGVRRSVLDWGVFHVKHDYGGVWNRYRQILKQRNALLRQTADYRSFVPWDAQLIQLAAEIHLMRSEYFTLLALKFQEILARLANIECSLEYYKGWDPRNTGANLEEIFVRQFAQDLKYQYTQSGAHQADLIFTLPKHKARQILSRGQQKIVLTALKLAQGILCGDSCIYLLDDIAAELDARRLDNLLCCLEDIPGQFLITAIDVNDITLAPGSSLHPLP